MVHSVTMPSGYGASGNTYTDDNDPTTGLDDYGYVDRLVPLMSDAVIVTGYAVTQAGNAATSANAAAASATSALNAPGTNATSTSSVTIATGSKSFTIQTGKAYVIGQTLNIASAADPSNFMAGQVTAYNSGTGALTINVTQTGGAGAKTDWVVSMGAIVSSTLPATAGNDGKVLMVPTGGGAASWSPGALGVAFGGTGSTTASAARTALGVAIGTNIQAYSTKLTALDGLSFAADKLPYSTGASAMALAEFTSFARTLLDDADASTMRSTLGLAIGSNVQAYDVDLTAIAALTSAADKLAYATGAGTWALTGFSSYARTLIDDGDAATARGTLGAAASGMNSDITSLSALSTPLSVTQGGTGAATRAAARANLGEMRGYATISGGALTDQFSEGHSISRSATGIIVITLDAAAASANTWSAIVTCSNLSTDPSEQITCIEQYNLKTSSTTTVHVRNSANGLRDPAWVNVSIYVDS